MISRTLREVFLHDQQVHGLHGEQGTGRRMLVVHELHPQALGLTGRGDHLGREEIVAEINLHHVAHRAAA